MWFTCLFHCTIIEKSATCTRKHHRFCRFETKSNDFQSAFLFVWVSVWNEICRNFKSICFVWHSAIWANKYNNSERNSNAMALIIYWNIVRDPPAKCLSFSWNAFARGKKGNFAIRFLLGIQAISMHLLFWCCRRSCCWNDICDLVRVVSVWGLPCIFHQNYMLSYSVWNFVWETIIQTTHEIRYAEWERWLFSHYLI